MVLVFQYGSNCLGRRLNSTERLNDNAEFYKVAKTVENYRLTFNVYSRDNKCAAADIIKTGYKSVWGILYNIPDKLMCRITTPSGKNSFDAMEGEGINYKRYWLPVICPDGEILIALTYVVCCPSKRKLKTKKEYAKYIIDGLKEHIKDEMPPEYIEEVKQIIKENNPSIDITKL